MLLSLETVQYLLTHHTPHHFPFLSLPANSRHRTSFHATLARLILSVTDDMANTFDAFMEPIVQVRTLYIGGRCSRCSVFSSPVINPLDSRR